ncbi:photosystem I P700 apoprotein A2, plastid [Artemisia annua]|uniref:Photosystem I P700 apoprotein A2, plastid n=1 Tax=Artemisia annua TaxID=35608 RepID=A0A2U1L2M4_ARTAN|nr:photosystem I P700 apoprotein A2, plastid [Artemisia annua]
MAHHHLAITFILLIAGHMYRTNFGIGHSMKDLLDAHIPPGGRLGRGHKGLYDTIKNSIHFQLGLALASLVVITSLSMKTNIEEKRAAIMHQQAQVNFSYMVLGSCKRKSGTPISVNGQPMSKPKKHCISTSYTEASEFKTFISYMMQMYLVYTLTWVTVISTVKIAPTNPHG